VHDATLIHLNALAQRTTKKKRHLCNAALTLSFLERGSRAIQDICRLANRLCGCIPVLLFNRVADKRVHGGLEAVVGVGREDDVFELCAVWQLHSGISNRERGVILWRDTYTMRPLVIFALGQIQQIAFKPCNLCVV
jgi:hypothetical protein